MQADLIEQRDGESGSGFWEASISSLGGLFASSNHLRNQSIGYSGARYGRAEMLLFPPRGEAPGCPGRFVGPHSIAATVRVSLLSRR